MTNACLMISRFFHFPFVPAIVAQTHESLVVVDPVAKRCKNLALFAISDSKYFGYMRCRALNSPLEQFIDNWSIALRTATTHSAKRKTCFECNRQLGSNARSFPKFNLFRGHRSAFHASHCTTSDRNAHKKIYSQYPRTVLYLNVPSDISVRCLHV